MASINKLEMLAALSADSRVNIKKSFFSTKAIHVPSGNAMQVVVNEYDANGAATIETILKAKDDRIEAEIQRVGAPKTAPIGCLRLEIVATPDHQFVALQAFRYADLRYKPVSDFRVFEGALAEAVAQLL